MPNNNGENKTCSRLADFYDGKSVFMTGASGFLGSVLLEILLRCIPGIRNIFVLVRPKKGVNPEKRKNIIFQKRIFKKVLKGNPSVVDKVIVIPGEISLPFLGMKDEDFSRVAKEASIIFHVAATISFLKPLRFTALHNCIGTRNVIELARRLTNLEVLVYTSTAYSNCNRHPIVEEIIYRLPWTATRFLEELEFGDFEKLAADCKPEWPNDYTFSKCLSENILADLASDLPVAIVRPSIIAASWKNSLLGYIEEGTGLVDFSLAVGKGFVRVVQADMNSRFDLIPVDIVANTHIAAAWSVATKNLESPFVINCTGGPWNVSFQKFCETLKDVSFKQLVPKSYQQPSLIVVQNKYLYSLIAAYEHYLPAYCLDVILRLKGSKLRLVKLYLFFEKVMKQLKFFTSTTFDFKMDNFNSLTEQMDSRDRQIFSMSRDEVDIVEMVRAIPTVNVFYDWKAADKYSPEKRKRTVLKRTIMIKFIKIAGTILICYLLATFLQFLYTTVTVLSEQYNC